MTAESVTSQNSDVNATLLRIQIQILKTLLKNIEQKNDIDEHTHESLKQVEKNLRWLRKLSLNSF